MSETTPNTNPTGGEQERSEVRENLREAGDALVAAGSAIGTAIGKATGELSDRFKTATESARQNLAQATTDHDVRNAASGFTDSGWPVTTAISTGANSRSFSRTVSPVSRSTATSFWASASVT